MIPYSRTKVPAYVVGTHVKAAIGFPVQTGEHEFKVDMLVHPPKNSPLCTGKRFYKVTILRVSNEKCMKVMRLEKCTSKTPQMAACSKMHEIIIHDILKKGRNLILRALSAESWGRG